MNTYLWLDGSLALQRFLREHATRHAKWREFKAWRIPGKEGFVVEWPAGLAAPVAAGCATVPLQPSMAAQPHFLLGDTWKRARPIPRDGRGHMAPSCYLLVVQGDIEHATKALVQQAPSELEFVTLSIDSSDDPKQLSGFIVRGEAGRMAASAPPYGCVSFECDEIRGGLAAFPIGWTAPPLLEELWPEMDERVLLYGVHGTDYSITTALVSRRLPVAELLTCPSKPQTVLVDAKSGMKQTPWRVIRRESTPVDDLNSTAEGGTTSVVYRLRTFDRASSAAGDLTSSRGHDLGYSFLQILDECEAGLLPEVLYAGIDVQRYERWHLLYVKDATERLLDAWNMVERFDQIVELETHGIHAYLSRRSSMLPPVKALLGGGTDDRAIGQRIRAMLGNPSKDTIVLIEDLEGDSRGRAGVEDGPPSNPRIIHIDRARAIPLSKILPDLVRDWHNAEPMAALESTSEPGSLTALREQLEQRLLAIGEDEDSELRTASETARNALATWATATAGALEKATAPVSEATQLCIELGNTLATGAASIQDTSSALNQYCDQLTAPRRAWVLEESQRTTKALRDSAPRIDEAASAQAEAEQAGSLLGERTTTLRRAAEALRAFEPRLDALQREGDAALARAAQIRSEVDSRARATSDRIAQRRQDVQEQLRAAQQVQGRLNDERERLRQDEMAVRQLEQANSTLRRANEDKTAELAGRRQRATAESQELTRCRDSEIPSLARQTENAAQPLAALDPPAIRAKLRDALQRLADVNRRIQETEQERERARELETEAERARAELRTQRDAADEAAATLAKAQAETQAVEQELAKQRDHLAHMQESGGSEENCEKRLKYAKKALAELESMKKAKGFLGGLFG